MDYDYGNPWIGCPHTQPFTISNVGDADLVVSSVQLTSASIEFQWLPPELLPLTLAPQQQTVFDVTYSGLDDFVDYAFFQVESNDPWQGEVNANITANAAHYGHADDEFHQPLLAATDILFVIDNSGSMAEEQAYLTENFEAFISTLQASDADYQLAVITTDNPHFRGDIMTQDTPNAVDAFNSQALAGTGGSGDERQQEMPYQATESGGDAGPGSDFLRDGAMLAIVVVTDEADEYSPDSPQEYVDSWVALKDGRDDLFRYHVVGGDIPVPPCATAAQASRPLDQTAALSGGLFVSVCAPDWGDSLEHIAAGSLTLHTNFPLSQAAVPGTLVVKVDGVTVTGGYTYDEATHTVIFWPDHIPPGGSTITCDYEILAPDCGG
jgi:hypothetical protein